MAPDDDDNDRRWTLLGNRKGPIVISFPRADCIDGKTRTERKNRNRKTMTLNCCGKYSIPLVHSINK